MSKQFFQLLTMDARTDRPEVGVLVNGATYRLEAAVDKTKEPALSRLPSLDMLTLLANYPASFDAISNLAHAFAESPATYAGLTVDLAGVHLRAPVPNPPHIYLAAANYQDHIQEMARAQGNPPPIVEHSGKAVFLYKASSATNGPYDQIVLPRSSKKVDWEVELAVVIGKGGKHISRKQSSGYVAGYTVMNDVSARDVLPRDQKIQEVWFGQDVFSCKCHDSFAPMGPYLTPAFFVDWPPALGMRLWVNGEQMQNSNSKNMIWGVDEYIEAVSEVVPLCPGDIISTGTPGGVGMGRNKYLAAGDIVEAEVDGIGRLRNLVVAEARS